MIEEDGSQRLPAPMVDRLNSSAHCFHSALQSASKCKTEPVCLVGIGITQRDGKNELDFILEHLIRDVEVYKGNSI